MLGIALLARDIFAAQFGEHGEIDEEEMDDVTFRRNNSQWSFDDLEDTIFPACKRLAEAMTEVCVI